MTNMEEDRIDGDIPYDKVHHEDHHSLSSPIVPFQGVLHGTWYGRGERNLQTADIPTNNDVLCVWRLRSYS